MAEERRDSQGEEAQASAGSRRESQSTSRKGSIFEKPVDLDDVLVNELGQFGRYQMLIILLVAFPIIMSAFMNEYIFSAAAIPHRCQIPECGEKSKSAKFRPDWILNAIPADDNVIGFASCYRYQPTGGNGTQDSCPATLFSSQVQDCDAYVYARDNTCVYDFDLGCQEWLRVLAGTMSSLGTLLVLPVTGYVSDHYGRRIALVISVANVAIFGVIKAFSVNYAMYLVLQLLHTTLGAGAYSSAFIFATEFVGPKYRVLTSSTAASMFSVGQIILGSVAWEVQPWRYMLLVLFIPCFLAISYYWILSESVRWLLSQQKYVEARKVLERVAKRNRTEISEKSMNALMHPPQPVQTADAEAYKKPRLFAVIFHSKVLLRRFCTTPIWWMTATFVYYGLSINATSLSDTMHLNFILTCAIEVPGFYTAVLILDRIGRKPTLSGGFLFSAACNISFAFIPLDLKTLRLIIYLLGKFGIAVVFVSLYLYTSELYPTEYRHSLLGFSSMIRRIGSITAPLTPVLMEYWRGMPSVMFGTLSIISGMLILTQPETLGTKLPDTLAEAAAIGTPSSKVKINSNSYVNYILTSLVEIPGYCLSYITLDRFGRKSSIMTAFIVCEIPLAALLFVLQSLWYGSLHRGTWLGTPRLPVEHKKIEIVKFFGMAEDRRSSQAEEAQASAAGSRKGSQFASRKASAFEKPLDLDDVLVNELGQFGRYQMLNILLVSLPIIMSAFMSEYIFSAAAIPHRCQVHECGENSKSANFEPSWVLNAIPTADNANGFASCYRYQPTGGNGTLNTCPATLFSSQVQECDGYVYARDNSCVYDFDLGCQDWLRALAGTLSSVGTLLVLPITGYVSDHFGRRVALVISVTNLAIFGVIRAFSVNYPMYLAMQLLQTTLGAGTYSSSYIFATEFVGPKYRVLTSATCSSMFAVGQIILGGVAWVVQPWRYMILTLHIPCFLIITYYWILSESVRWLLSKQKYVEARRVLKRVAKRNRTEISEKSMNALLNPPQPVQTKDNEAEIKPSLFAVIFRSKVLFRRILTTPIWWITTTFVYYGLSINATSLSDTMYLNFILTCAIEIPGFYTAVLVLDRIGRKPTLSGGFLFSAVCNIAFAFIPDDLTVLRLIIYLLGKFGISVVFTSLYLYTSELYPTEYRHSLLGFSSMIGRIGSITAPLTPVLMEYWQGIPSVMFGAMGIISGILVLTQPETLGTKMPDTLAEAEAIGTPSSKVQKS